MDSTDRKILAIVQEDASLAVAEVASRVNLSQTPCWRRIQKLFVKTMRPLMAATADFNRSVRVSPSICSIVGTT